MFKNYVKNKLIPRKGKVYKFDHKFKERFYDLNWGVSHSCFQNEPFGYGIFEAVDWGKLPIIHTNWHIPLDYKYKASNKEEFLEMYDIICNDSYETKQLEHQKLKNWMQSHFSDKELWKQKLLDIYNEE